MHSFPVIASARSLARSAYLRWFWLSNFFCDPAILCTHFPSFLQRQRACNSSVAISCLLHCCRDILTAAYAEMVPPKPCPLPEEVEKFDEKELSDLCALIEGMYMEAEVSALWTRNPRGGEEPRYALPSG